MEYSVICKYAGLRQCWNAMIPWPFLSVGANVSLHTLGGNDEYDD